MKVIEFSRKAKNSKPKAEVEAMIKAMRKEDERMVKGMFEFTEAEGGFFMFNYRIYPGDPIRTIQLLHGEICEIPMGIIKILHGSKKKISTYMNVEQAANGPIKPPREVKKTSRLKFTPSEYL